MKLSPILTSIKFILLVFTFKSTWNWFSGGVPEELWTEVCNIVQEAVIKTIPKKKKRKKAKRLSGDALQITESRSEGKGEKER